MPMSALRLQQTVAGPTQVKGFGYWSGQDVCVEFCPAPPDSGITFLRGDLAPAVQIPAVVANRVKMPRRTNLVAAGAQVEMVEHVLAALAGLGIDNCEVRVDAAEMPGCDGSAQAFVAALDEVGTVIQDVPCCPLVVEDVLRVGTDDAWIEARPNAAGELSIKYELDYGTTSPIGRQSFELTVSPAAFRRELAASRTFLTDHEARQLKAQGLGGRVTPRDLLVIGAAGPINNPLRFPNECARHKALDVVGDLALAGAPLHADIVAYRSGHELNAELVRRLLAHELQTTCASRCA